MPSSNPGSAPHKTALTHHLSHAAHWLHECDGGRHSTYVTYAALETRYGVERLAVHYWSQLEHGAPEAFDTAKIGSFKHLENAIYRVAGHQRDIERTYAYSRSCWMRCVFRGRRRRRTFRS